MIEHGSPLSFIAAMAYFMPRNTPVALMPMRCSHSSSVVSSTSWPSEMPALLTSTLSLP